MKADKLTSKRFKLKISEFLGVSSAMPESVLPQKYSPNAYNFTFRNGALKSDLGLVNAQIFFRSGASVFTAELPALGDGKVVKDVMFYHRFDYVNGERADRLIAVSGTGIAYYTEYYPNLVTPPEWKILSNVVIGTGKICSVNYNFDGTDVLIVSSGAGTYLYDGSQGRKLHDCPEFTSLAKHYERIYGSTVGSKKRVWFSDSLDPTDWTVAPDGAGYLDFNDEGGDVLKVMSFSSYLFIFREHEILRLRAFGEQTDFTLSKLFTSVGRIYEDTIALAGDRIIFLSEDGLYQFNGESATRICKDIVPYLDAYKGAATACYLGGKYYIALRFLFPDKKVVLDEAKNYASNALIEYDIKEGNFSILRGVDVRKLVPVNVSGESHVYAILGSEPLDKIGMISEKSKSRAVILPKFWTSGATDFGYPDKKKVVREVYAEVKGNIVLGVVIDGKTFEFPLKRENPRARVGLGGKVVSFYFRSDSLSAEVAAPTVYFDLV